MGILGLLQSVRDAQSDMNSFLCLGVHHSRNISTLTSAPLSLDLNSGCSDVEACVCVFHANVAQFMLLYIEMMPTGLLSNQNLVLLLCLDIFALALRFENQDPETSRW